VNSKMESLFEAAVQLPAAQREAFLARECTDPEMRQELDSLLHCDGFAENLLEGAISREAAFLLEGHALRPGDLAGQYRILFVLGHGGMGEVYLAERADGKFTRQVAIKVIYGGPNREATAARLEQEYRILARLEHPNVARMVDAGTAKSGLPYFAMDYVAGEPIDTYCEKHNLSVEERLRLMLPVCDAVHFAHQNLIVHRDLKPRNILVDQHGNPRLLDFGIARMLDDVASSGDTAAYMLTPDYASPEQARGEPVSTATDIYSLGALLYKLLTGVPPHQLEGKNPLESLKVISEEPVQRPSQICPSLSRELDDLLCMAMAPEPSERYRSADRLAADIENWLAKRPLEARRDTAFYRSRKFIRRHWISVSSSVLAILALAAIATIATWEARRAERRFNDVRHLANVSLLDIEGAMHNVAGATKARLLAVRTAEEYLERLSHEAGGDPGLTRELAAAYEKLGDILGNPGAGNVGDATDAVHRYRQAKSLLESLHAGTSGSLSDAMTLAEIENKLTGVESRTGDEDGLRRDTEAALSLASKIAQTAPKDNRAEHLLASAMLNKAALEIDGKDFASGQKYMRTALAIETSLAESSHSRADRISLGSSYRAACTQLERLHDYDGAMDMCSRAAVLYGQLAAEDSTSSEVKRNRMIALTTVGSIQSQLASDRKLGFPVAIATQRQAWAIASEAAAADPANAEALSDMSAVAIRLAHTFADAHRYSEALPLLDRAVAASNELLERDPENRDFRTTLAFGYGYLGYVDGLKGDYAIAVAERTKAASIYRQLVVEAPGDVRALDYEVWNWLELGKMLAKQKKYLEARGVFHQAMQEAAVAGPGNPAFKSYIKDLQYSDQQAAKELAANK